MFNLLHIENLPKVDSGLEGSSCDSFVILNFSNIKEFSIKSKTVKNNLNPVFKQTLYQKIEFDPLLLKNLKIHIKVFDHDNLSTNDLIGTLELDNIEKLFIE